MMSSLLNRGLLWKEWRQNRWYFLLTGLLMAYVPVIKSLYFLFFGSKPVSEWEHLNHIAGFAQGYGAAVDPWGMVTVILLGALMLGEERKGSLTYLVSTPVSRSQIILAKFLVGSGIILLMMMVNSAFLLGMENLFPLPYNRMDVLHWAVLSSLVFLGLYTLTLLTSTFTSTVLAAGGLFFGLVYLPRAVVYLITVTADKYFSASQSFLIKAYNLGSYLTLTDYLTRSRRDKLSLFDASHSYTVDGFSGKIYPGIWTEGLYLILMILVLLLLAIVIFERSSLEPGGTIFAGRRARRCSGTTIAILLGWLLTLSWADSVELFFLSLAGLTLAVLALPELFSRVGRLSNKGGAA